MINHRHLDQGEGQRTGLQFERTRLTVNINISKSSGFGQKLFSAEQHRVESNPAVADHNSKFSEAGDHILFDLPGHTRLLNAGMSIFQIPGD